MERVGEWINPFERLKGVFYGWWLVSLGAIALAFSTLAFQGITIWNPVLRGQFAWSTAQVAWGFSFARVEGSLSGPLAGYLVDKLGPRRMVFIGLLVQGIGFVLFSRVQELWEFYVAFLVMSLGAGVGTWLPIMTVLNNWFVRRRAMAIALAMEGVAVGGIALLPALAWAVNPDEPDRFGWRATSVVLGVLIMVLAFPMSKLFRNRPEDYGQYPDGRPPAPVPVSSPEARSPTATEPSYTWQQAIRTRAFWFISIGHAASAIVIATVTVHLGLLLDDRGFSLQTVGWIVSVVWLAAAVFTLVGGFVGDRVPIRMAVFGFTAMQSVALLVLILFQSEPMAFLFAVLLGIGFGGRIPLSIAIRGVYFGRKAFGSITGISMIPTNALVLGAPIFVAYMFDTTGKYGVSFFTIAAVCLLGSSMFLLLGDPKPLPPPPRGTLTHGNLPQSNRDTA